MNSKKWYIGGGAAAFLAAFLMSLYTRPEYHREQQHLTYNTEVEDTNLSIDKDAFSSRLPVVSINTGGLEIPGKPAEGQLVREVENSFIRAEIQIMEREGKLHTLKDEPDLESDIAIRVRGNSSRGFDKVGYLFKFVDKDDKNKEYEVMGMDESDTWVLHGPFLDKSLLRNYMWYNLSGQILEWSPDVRYCEVFLNDEYQGIYVMTEQISVGKGRVEISKYDGRSNVSSYIVCVDRESVNDVSYLDNFTEYAKRIKGKVEVKYPGEKNLTPEITDYISRDFSTFEKSLYSFDYDSRRYGYWKYIDVDNFVDYFIINEVSQNTDAGLFSTFFYKDVAGKLKLSVWDFNNCCDNYMEEQQPMAGFFMQERPWFYMLMRDEEFTEKIILRYKQLRKGVLSDEYVNEYIESVTTYLGPAVERNYKVWGYTFEKENDLLIGENRQISSYEAALKQYRDRLTRRMGWMDSHIEAIRSYSHESVNKKFNH